MKNIFFMLITSICLFGAQTTQISISADSFEADENKHQTLFNKNVLITKNLDKIKASKAIVNFNQENKPIKYTASGKVEFSIILKDSTLYGGCDELVFVPKSKVYILNGHVNINELPTKRKIQATKVIIDTKSNKINITGEKNKPVKFIFEVEEK